MEWVKCILFFKVEDFFGCIDDALVDGWTSEKLLYLVIFESRLNSISMINFIHSSCRPINTKDITYGFNMEFVELLFDQTLGFLTLCWILNNLIVIARMDFLHAFMDRFFVNSA